MTPMLIVFLFGLIIVAVGVYIVAFVKPASPTSPQDQVQHTVDGVNLNSDPIRSTISAFKDRKVAEAVTAKANAVAAYDNLLQHQGNIQLGPERYKTAFMQEKVMQGSSDLTLTLIDEARKLGIDLPTLNAKKLNEWATDEEIRKDDHLTMNAIKAVVYERSLPLRTAEFYLTRMNEIEAKIFQLQGSTLPKKLKAAQIANWREFQQIIRTKFYEPATAGSDSEEAWTIPERLKGEVKSRTRKAAADNADGEQTETPPSGTQD
jgi:hypothetical protein